MIRRTPIRKRSAKARLVSEADKLVRELVFARDRVCLRCGGTGAPTPFHIKPKGKFPRLRFELLNVIRVCWPCHRYHWHDDPIGGREWLEDKLPGRIDQLNWLAAIAPKVDVKELIAGLRVEVEALNKSNPDKEPGSGEQTNARCEPLTNRQPTRGKVLLSMPQAEDGRILSSEPVEPS